MRNLVKIIRELNLVLNLALVLAGLGCAKVYGPIRVEPTNNSAVNWISLNVAIKEGAQRLIYSLGSDGIVRGTCHAGITGGRVTKVELTKDQFGRINGLVEKIQREIRAKDNWNKRIVISITKPGGISNTRTIGFNSPGDNLEVNEILKIFKEIIPLKC
ncbi:MAG: hypothetical protein NZT61_02110 [Deltaproteobacteria bacterium]|nr:hypothetical protein [Deltaproteobacteria bacterium]